MQQQIIARDKLTATVQIENDALGSYTDMHLHGQRIHKEKWLERVRKTEEKRIDDLRMLDETFIPIVGRKSEAIDEAELNRLEAIWKNDFELATPEEMTLAASARKEKDPIQKELLKQQRKDLEKIRKDKKAAARANYMVLSKGRTKAKALIEKCEGEAFINYNSGTQLLPVLQKMPGMKKLPNTTDDALLT
jgi:tellurite resistance protein